MSSEAPPTPSIKAPPIYTKAPPTSTKTTPTKMLERLEVKNFLFCWGLKPGSLLLGNVLLVLNFLVMVISLLQYDITENDLLRSLYHGLLAVASICIPVALLLIIGVIYKKRVLFLPYLVVLGVMSLGLLVGSVLLPVFLGLITSWMALPWGVCFLLLGSLALVLHSWLVVFSYHRQLGRSEDDATEMKVQDSSPRADEA